MKETELLRAKAWELHGEGDLAKAEGIYRKLLNKEGAEEDAINLGALLRRLGRFLEASSHYKKWINIHPKNLTLRLNGINCLIEAGELNQAQEWVIEGLKVQPAQIELLESLSRSYMASGKREEALKILENIVSTHPQEINAWLDLGLCRYMDGKYELALAAFKTAYQLDPLEEKASANQIRMLEELGRWNEAEALIDGSRNAGAYACFVNGCDTSQARRGGHVKECMMMIMMMMTMMMMMMTTMM